MRSAAAAKGGDAIVGDPVLEVQRLRRLVSAKEEENGAILDLQKQMQAQLREAVQRADAAEAAAAKATERATRAEADLAEAGATVEDLAHQLETRDDDALRLERELAQAKHNAADAAAAAGEAASHARVESAGLMQAEARAASAELRADKLAAAAEEAAQTTSYLEAKLKEVQAENAGLRGRVRELETQVSLSLSSLTDLQHGGPADRRLRVDGVAAQQIEVLTQQVAAKDRQLVAKDRQLAALKLAREDLQTRVDATAGPGGYAKLLADAERDAAEAADAARAALAKARSERDALAVALERVGGATAVDAALREVSHSGRASSLATSGGEHRGGAPSSSSTVAQRAALERADEALAQCDVLRRERAELRRRVAELEALCDPKVQLKASQSESSVMAAHRRADVAERQLAVVKADREALRVRLEEAERQADAGGDAMQHAAAPDGGVAAVKDELASAQARVMDALTKLRDREKVLVKVLARTQGVAGGAASAAGAAATALAAAVAHTPGSSRSSRRAL